MGRSDAATPPMISAASARQSSASEAYAAGMLSSKCHTSRAWCQRGIDIERELCEGTQPGDHPEKMVDREAVDQHCPAAISSKRRAAGPKRSLSGGPSAARTPRRRGGAVERLADKHERLEKDEIRPLLLKHARQQLDRPARRRSESASSDIGNATAHWPLRSASSTAR